MNRMNKKAMESWALVTIIVAIFFLVIASFAIIPKLSGLGGWIQENVGFNFGTKETATETIDEERIDAGTEISVEKVSSDTKSGYTTIVKQPYGQGWNLESAFYKTFNEDTACPWYWSEQECTDAKKMNAPLLANKKISEILSNDDDKLRGAITVNGKTYIHAPDPTDTDPTTSDLFWYEDKNANAQYDPTIDTRVEPSDLAPLIAADLFNQAGGATS